jgi:predicted site-specific integrase-resolvase
MIDVEQIKETAIYSISDTCSLLGGIHRNTLYRWRDKGLLPISPTSPKYRGRDIVRFIKRNFL